jgi:CelD/BcsL family acetyltransferase involved in cellulose biosynthesis
MWSYWNATRRNNENACLLGIFRGDELVAATALRLRKVLGAATVAEFLTEGRSDSQGIAGEQSLAVANAVLRYLRGRGIHGAVRFNEMAEGSPMHEACRLAHGEPKLTREYPCPYRDLTASAPPESGSNKSFQKRIPNYRRRLEAFGAAQLKVLDFDSNRSECLEWLPKLFALHDLRHADRRNAWKDVRNREFLVHYAKAAEKSNLLAFVTLLDGMPVAFDLGFRCGNKFVLYIPAFHPSFEKFRLGHINRWMTFAECAKLGIDHYDFSRGDSFAKRVWAHGAVDNYSCTFPLSGSFISKAATFALRAPVRLKAWMRDHNQTSRIAAIVEFAKGPQSRKSTSSMPAALRREAGPLRYSRLAGLPEAQMTQLVEFVFAQQCKEAEWQISWPSPSLLCASLTPEGPSIEIAC